MVKGPTKQCRSEGNGVVKRTAAWCVCVCVYVSPIGGNLSSAMMRGGAQVGAQLARSKVLNPKLPRRDNLVP